LRLPEQTMKMRSAVKPSLMRMERGGRLMHVARDSNLRDASGERPGKVLGVWAEEVERRGWEMAGLRDEVDVTVR